jgi:two-component system OmpR family sensor kinase/two-component system sensor histidine kinase BaeS
MRSLFWKGMLAFLAVILVAVGTIALLSGWITEVEFRRYAFTQSGRWDRQVAELAAYFAEHGSWEGVQATVSASQDQGAGQQGRRGTGRSGGAGPPSIEFRVVDVAGRVVGDSSGDPHGIVPEAELKSTSTIDVKLGGQVVGYLVPSYQEDDRAPATLDVDQTLFLSRVRAALWVAALSATIVALIIGGLLFRSIILPLGRLTAASQTIAAGDLSVRAPVQGQDEVAKLANAFNQMAATLDQARKARQNQTADVAHELRTPLTVLQGALEAMLDGVYPTNRENLVAALTQVQTLGRLVEDLRVLALADAGELSLSMARLDLSDTLREIVEAYQVSARERDISLNLEAPPSLPLVRIDRERLAQVIGNLLTNALRYLSKGDRITVRAVDHTEEIEVAVIDTGPGMRPEDHSHLFDRFWRGDRARRRATGGSGLGLPIARALIEAHGGRLWATSKDGEGSTFTFTLPVSAGE